jgi:hypothetical protein
VTKVCGTTVQFLPHWFHTSSAQSRCSRCRHRGLQLVTTIMGKSRKQVSSALYTELSEYSSLIRALRTSDTLDLASQLTRPQPAASTSQLNTPESDEDQTEVTTPNASTSREISPSVGLGKGKGKGRLKGSRKAGSSERAKSKAKDNWTQWPLLAGDIHAPEFEFRDEIKALALHVVQSQRLEDSNDAALSDDDDTDDDDEDTILPPSLLDSLTLASATHLSQVLSALAAHIPLMEKSMQNRIKPIGWESVLDIVAVTGLVDPKSVFDPSNTWL